MSEGGSCDETTAKKGNQFVAITKKDRQFLGGKIGVTSSVAAPGDQPPVTPLLAVYCRPVYDAYCHRHSWQHYPHSYAKPCTVVYLYGQWRIQDLQTGG